VCLGDHGFPQEIPHVVKQEKKTQSIRCNVDGCGLCTLLFFFSFFSRITSEAASPVYPTRWKWDGTCLFM
jgi:hypothetical protein